MDRIIISGVDAYDGPYDFDPSFTNRELHTIKRLTGVRAGELGDALEAGDSDLLVALAAIAIVRAGKQLDENLLWDAEGGSITYEGGIEEEDDADPPPSLIGDGLSSADVAKSGSSGGSGTNVSASSPTVQSGTGQASSALSVTSGQST